jgi:tripartite-type tricarboxylate transporter receptor subunit TctC
MRTAPRDGVSKPAMSIQENLMRRRLLAVASSAFLLAAAFLPSAAVHAAEYPNGPISMIVPYAPGGSSDTVARIIGNEVSKELGQPIIILNRSGAGGNIGFEMAARAQPDGYTLLMASSPLAVNVSLYPKLGYDPATDFAPISLVALQPNLLVVSRELPVKTLAELIAYAKANPGQLNFGSSGVGTSQHLAGELFKRRAGIDIVHVPYRGGGPAMVDLVGGRLQMMFETIPSSLPFAQSGQVRAIAITVDARSKMLPDVPTVSEAGLPGFVSRGWLGVAAPAKTPKPIIDKLNAAFRKALETPSVAEQLTQLGLQVKSTSPGEFATFIGQEINDYRNIITSAKITLD